MADSIWTETLATFRDRIASLEPVPGGVSVAAVSATLGMGTAGVAFGRAAGAFGALSANRTDEKADPNELIERDRQGGS